MSERERAIEAAVAVIADMLVEPDARWLAEPIVDAILAPVRDAASEVTEAREVTEAWDSVRVITEGPLWEAIDRLRAALEENP